MHIDSLVPLDPDELIATASRNVGLSNFGSDDWREPFVRLVAALNDEAELNLVGRLMTRSDLLRFLEARLGIEEAYRQHPEIDAEVIDAPMIVVGRPRTGTSILYEVLAQDPQFGSPKFWELTFPYPPPEAASYRNDPRIKRSDLLTKQWARVTPSWAAIHEQGATIPGECVYALSMSFTTGMLFGSIAHVPSYLEWVGGQDAHVTYAFYKRTLKVLQWRNPRRHWLLKCPSHIEHLPIVFDTFPDAQVILTHRDPVASHGSVSNAVATHRYMRSDRPFDIVDEALFNAVIQSLDKVIDEIEQGALPPQQIHHIRFADILSRPLEMIGDLYAAIGLELTPEARIGMEKYIENKPRHKFGRHVYDVGDEVEVRRKRDISARYQAYFGCPSEF